MLLIRSKRTSSAGENIEGAVILWYSVSGSIPSGWSVYEAAKGAFIQGVSASAIDTTISSSGSHTHSNAATTASEGIHSHTGEGSTDVSSATNWKIYTAFAPYSNVALAGHAHQLSVTLSNNSSAHTHSLTTTGSASAEPAFMKLYWIKSTGSFAPPIGSITIFGASASSIPRGWNICNGTSGTVDLRDKFVYGASIDGDVGTTGGGGHSHTNSNTGSDGAHTHTASMSSGVGSNSSIAQDTGQQDVPNSGHSHSVASQTSSSSGAHTHTVPNSNSTLSTPPYVKLNYIQRVF